MELCLSTHLYLFCQLICSLHKVRKASILSKVARKSSIITMAQDPTVDRIDDHLFGGHTVVDRVDDLFGGKVKGNADGIVAELREKDRKRRLSVEEQQLLRTKQAARKLDHDKKRQKEEMKKQEKERMKKEIFDAEVSAYHKMPCFDESSFYSTLSSKALHY
jgi:hypothetical protein